MKGTLYLIPTPLSLDSTRHVLSPEIRDTIAKLDYFLVENVRTIRRFISSLQLNLVIDHLQLELLDKDTDTPSIIQYLQPVLAGRNVGILSEAGCPAVADPGSLAVAIAHQLNIKVVPLVGPSSILLALMASGMNGQRFAFHGYLPIEDKDRERTIKQLELESIKLGQTQLFIETSCPAQKPQEALF